MLWGAVCMPPSDSSAMLVLVLKSKLKKTFNDCNLYESTLRFELDGNFGMWNRKGGKM